jgi:hypothetical protein
MVGRRRTHLIIVNQIEYFGSDVHANLPFSPSYLLRQGTYQNNPAGNKTLEIITNQSAQILTILEQSQSRERILEISAPDLRGINLSSGSIPPLFPSPASFHNLLYRPKCHIVRPNSKKNPTMTGMKVRPVCVGERDLEVKTIG